MLSISPRWKRARCWPSSSWRRDKAPVVAGLDPASPIVDAPSCLPKRGGRDKPGHDEEMSIRITDEIFIDESEIAESFVRSSGPGGQNVNKLSTAVQLRFDVRRSPSLPNDVAVRLMRLAGKSLNKEGVLVIVVQNHRIQVCNGAQVVERLDGRL